MATRKIIAKANGIEGYSGTAEQNTKMLNLLKQGKLINPGNVYFRPCNASRTTLYSGLQKIGADPSLAYRKKIAKKNGITDYADTVDQNEKMLQLLKDGKLLVP